MSTLNIVMVEPEIPQNTGNVARTCAVTGARLHLVGPMGFAIDDRKLKRAGLDYWHMLDITYYQSLDEFFEKTPVIFSFSHRKACTVIPMSPTPTIVICFLAKKPPACRNRFCAGIRIPVCVSPCCLAHAA